MLLVQSMISITVQMPLLCVYTLDPQPWYLSLPCFRRGKAPCRQYQTTTPTRPWWPTPSTRPCCLAGRSPSEPPSSTAWRAMMSTWRVRGGCNILGLVFPDCQGEAPTRTNIRLATWLGVGSLFLETPPDLGQLMIRLCVQY